MDTVKPDDDEDEGVSPEGAGEAGKEPAPAPVERPPETTLTEEQVTALAGDPRMVQRVLQGREGQTLLDDLLNRVMGEKEQAAAVEVQKKEAQASLDEALAAADEGDFEKMGRLAAARLREERVVAPVRAQAYEAARSEYYATLDDTVEAAGLSDAAAALTPQELQSLRRENFRDDPSFVKTVMKALVSKHNELITGRSRQDTKAAEEAARNAAAARTARGAPPALQGGSARERASGGEDIGTLIRSEVNLGGDDDSD